MQTLRSRMLAIRWLGIAIWVTGASWPSTFAQTVLAPWGTIQGVRVAGELAEFEAGPRWIHPGWSGFSTTVKYQQRPRYQRTGSTAVVESTVDGVDLREELHDTGSGSATLKVQVTSRTNLSLAGGYFCFHFPDSTWGGARVRLEGTTGALSGYEITETDKAAISDDGLRRVANGASFVSTRNKISIRWDDTRQVIVRHDSSNRPSSINDPSVRQHFETRAASPNSAGLQFYVELFSGDAIPGTAATATFRWEVQVKPDPSPVRIALDFRRPGRAFDGIGGNFRLQFPETDPAVIRYNLEGLPVTWGRLDLPWSEWHPTEDIDPLNAARTAPLHPKWEGILETLRTLARRQIPVILSVWNPPRWARAPVQSAGLRGTALNTSKLDRICESLATALVFAKERTGLEATFFSLNEPETGVEVRQTPEEHAEFIRRMGPALLRRGLSTRLLLGDTAHGTPAALEFLAPSIDDPSLHRFLGAVAFHTWRGCTESDLNKWSEASRRLGIPLLVTEAGPDAHLHEYPAVRLEPWFPLQEIELYLRCCAHAQPATIMEWQLTTDYSVLTGGGVYGETGALKPTQRYWNLLQLGSMPKGTPAVPIIVDTPGVTGAAFGDMASGFCAIHLVNRGGTRTAQLSGLPPKLTKLSRWVTDATRGRAEESPVEVKDGILQWVLPPASYTTLQGNR